MIRVLIVEDSPTQRAALVRLIGTAPDMTVVGEAENGLDAVQMAQALRPDVISMDVRMPRLDGLGATRQIMDSAPTPIVVVSAAGKGAEAIALLQAGALSAIEKLPSPHDPAFQIHANELLTMLRLMSGVRVIRRWNPDKPPTRPLSPPRPRATGPLVPTLYDPVYPPSVIVVGASAGGPSALEKVLPSLPAGFPVPILVVQHLSTPFVTGFTQWLDRACALTVKLAEHDEPLVGGTIYVAPGGSHLRIGADKRLVLDSVIGQYRHCPAVDALFLSAADVFGPRTVGVLLTGMGDDGALGLRKLRDAGARTLVQDEETCVVYGMPAAAVELGAAEFILPLPTIGLALFSLAGQRESSL